LIEYFIEKYKYFVQVSITIDDKWYFEIYNLIDKRNGELPVPFTYYKTKDDAYHEAFKYLLIKVL
jgi:hypothetical protein